MSPSLLGILPEYLKIRNFDWWCAVLLYARIVDVITLSGRREAHAHAQSVDSRHDKMQTLRVKINMWSHAR